jgi:hypothetical protein
MAYLHAELADYVGWAQWTICLKPPIYKGLRPSLEPSQRSLSEPHESGVTDDLQATNF